jgi:hypothetical protein
MCFLNCYCNQNYADKNLNTKQFCFKVFLKFLKGKAFLNMKQMLF